MTMVMLWTGLQFGMECGELNFLKRKNALNSQNASNIPGIIYIVWSLNSQVLHTQKTCIKMIYRNNNLMKKKISRLYYSLNINSVIGSVFIMLIMFIYSTLFLFSTTPKTTHGTHNFYFLFPTQHTQASGVR